MYWLIKTTLPVFISFIITFFLSKIYKNLGSQKNFLIIFSTVWVFSFLLQYFILGEYSPITYRDNADQSLSRILHDLNYHLGGKFAHNIYGGSDYHAVQGYLAGLITLERFVFSIFPIWIGVLIHKFLLVTISFFGSYLLFTKGFNFDKLNSIFASSLLSIINPWATYHSLQHGIGFAIIYLAIYVYLYTSSNKNFLIYSTLLSAFVAISISPLHSFQALLGGLVLTGFVKKPENIKLTIISILILTFFVLINWSEVLYGLYTYGEYTTRVLTDQNHQNIFGGIVHVANKSDYCFANCNYQYSPIIIILILALIGLVTNFNKDYLKILLFLIICNYIPNFVWFVTEVFKFDKINSMNFYEFSFYLYVPISILALKISQDSRGIFKKLPLVFLFFAITIMFHDKIKFFKKIYYEPQTKIHMIQNLKEKNWKKNELSRTTTLFPLEEFHPNFAWAYGFETSDGWAHFILKNYQFYWDYGVLRKDYIPGHYKYGANLYVNHEEMVSAVQKGEEINLEKFLDLNLLGLINNNYIFSYTPVSEKQVKKISGPDKPPYHKLYEKQRGYQFYIDDIKNRHKYLTKPPDIYVYEIQNVSDRAFFPSGILRIEKTSNYSSKYKFMSKNYKKNISFSEIDNLKSGSGKIIKVEKIKNGYKIITDTLEPGVLVLNSFYLPYWKVFINGKKSSVINMGDIHMGVDLKKGLNEIKFLYDRETLAEKYLKIK